MVVELTSAHDERERMYIEILDVYEDMESLIIWMIVILYVEKNCMRRIVLYKMYLRYLTGDRDVRKNCKIFK